jgi:hypothetical protein
LQWLRLVEGHDERSSSDAVDRSVPKRDTAEIPLSFYARHANVALLRLCGSAPIVPARKARMPVDNMLAFIGIKLVAEFLGRRG